MVESAGSPAESDGDDDRPVELPRLGEVAVDLTLGVISLGAAGLRAVPDLAARLPIRAAGFALVASERAQVEYEALLVRGADLRSRLGGMLSARLLGPPIVEDEPAEVDPFDLILLADPADQDDIDLPGDAPRVPLVVVPPKVVVVETPPPVEAADDLPLAGFDTLSLGALRARARQLGITDLETLLEHERTHGKRSGVLSLLETRIAQLQQEQSAG
jgi:hypothetical protein